MESHTQKLAELTANLKRENKIKRGTETLQKLLKKQRTEQEDGRGILKYPATKDVYHV